MCMKIRTLVISFLFYPGFDDMEDTMYLMIDNYDSFVYNLKAYFEELGREIIVKRSDQITVDEIEKIQPQGIIL